MFPSKNLYTASCKQFPSNVTLLPGLLIGAINFQMISLDNLLSPKEASDRVIVAFAFSNQCELLFYFILTFSFNLSLISISLQCRIHGLKMFSFSLDSIHLLILVFLSVIARRADVRDETMRMMMTTISDI